MFHVKKVTVTMVTVALSLILLSGCFYNRHMSTEDARCKDLKRRYDVILPYAKEESPGAVEVLTTAYEALSDGYKAGLYPDVSIEDLWAESLQEGRMLFKQPETLWGPTTAEETADMIGQTTVGPWQMTVWNVRDNFGPKYGLQPGLSNKEIITWCRENPVYQARMIADYIEDAYSKYGVRGPYAIQSYFWLEPYVKGDLGQSAEWWKSPVAKPPKGKTWKDLTPEMKRDTGFYAKQVLFGHHGKPEGMVYWLAITGDDAAIRYLISTWKNEPKRKWNSEKKFAELTSEPGNFALTIDDLLFWPEDAPELKQKVEMMIMAQ